MLEKMNMTKTGAIQNGYKENIFSELETFCSFQRRSWKLLRKNNDSF